MTDGSGQNSLVSFARYDRASSSWRTCQVFLFEGSDESSVIWPRSGMTRNGTASRLPPLVRHIDVTASSSWPTPANRDYRYPNARAYSARGGGKKGEQLPNAVGGPLSPRWVEWLMGFPDEWTA